MNYREKENNMIGWRWHCNWFNNIVGAHATLILTKQTKEQSGGAHLGEHLE